MSVHHAYLSLGANLGHRQANLLQALQFIQTRTSVKRISSFYETDPVGLRDQPRFINVACFLETELSPRELLDFVKWIEKRLGRRSSIPNAPRPIDIDLLLYDETVIDTPELVIPHPRMHERAFALVPLAEIAPETLAHPVLKKTIRELLASVSSEGVCRIERSVGINLERDVQQSQPSVAMGLSRAGVTGLERIIRISDGNRDIHFYAELDLFADLNANQTGVHMSRFSDVLEEIIEEISIEPSPDIESLAERLARQVLKSQQTVRSEVHIRAHSPMRKTTPVTGKSVEELYTLIGIAAATSQQTRSLVGVETEGVTACPCAQDMVRSYSRELLLDEGFSESDAGRILEVLPIASHNQRGRGTLLVGSRQQVRAENLVHIVEASMSSETYELLKRPDEFFVVNKAHRNPKFVEDVVREMLRNVVEIYPDLPDDAFVLAKQVNFEGIHKHNAFAERYGTLQEIRREMVHGQPVTRHTTLQDWLLAEER